MTQHTAAPPAGPEKHYHDQLAQGRFQRPLGLVGPVLGLLVGAGNVAMPIACMLGLVTA